MGSSPHKIDFALDLEWTPSALGDYILDMDDDQINLVFNGKETKSKNELNDVLAQSLFSYLTVKNQRANPDCQSSVIANKMQQNMQKWLKRIRSQLPNGCLRIKYQNNKRK